MILLLGGEKGGTGKSTLTVNLAVLMSNEGRDLLLVDSDIQGTSANWCNRREDGKLYPPVVKAQNFGDNLKKDLRAHNAKYDDLIVDTPGRDSKELRSGLIVADIAIFPLQPSDFDFDTVVKINKHVGDARVINDKLKAYVVLSQANTHANIDDLSYAKEKLADFDNLDLLETVICKRRAFIKAAILGQAVTEFKPNDIKATEEIMNLYKEILNVAKED
jgi:chromosome partitioning protein